MIKALFDRLRRSPQRPPDPVPQAARNGDMTALPEVAAHGDMSALLKVAQGGDADARGAALDALGTVEPREWPALDAEIRRSSWYAPPRTFQGDDTLRLVMAASHHDGRIREAAVTALAGRREAAVVAVLVLRAGDWVAQVRQAARKVITGWPTPPELDLLVELAFVVSERQAGNWLVEHIDALLPRLPAARLEPLLAAADTRTRRAACQAMITAGLLDLDRLLPAAVRDTDQIIRAMCARAATAVADPAQLRPLLAARSAPVRAEALRELIARGDAAAAEGALTDRSPRVRAIAQSAFPGAAEYYRRLVGREPPALSALAGLGETGGRGDADVLARWLSHPRARGRAEAVRALRRLGVPPSAALVPLLRDGSAAVTRQVVVSLRRDASAVDPALLWRLLAGDDPAHVRFAAHRLLTSGDTWQRLAADLRTADDPDQRLRAAARADLTAWLSTEAATAYRRPRRERAEELDGLIERARPALGDRKARQLRFHAGLDDRG